MIDVFDKLLLNDKLNSNLPIDDLHLNGAGYRILVYTLRVFYVSRDECCLLYTSDAADE